MNCLQVESVRVVAFRDTKEIVILDGLDFSVERGEVISIVGPSGCGKTTLLHAVAGLRPFEGTILFDGTVNRPEIGYAFQTPRLLNWKTIEQNVAIVLHTLNGNIDGSYEAVARAIYAFEVQGFAGKYPLFCSEGEKARAGLARAFVNDPALILMDEPFAHLDMLTAETLRQRLKHRLADRRQTMLFVTHDLVEAAGMSDRILILTGKPTRVRTILSGGRWEQGSEALASCIDRLHNHLEVFMSDEKGAKTV